jgi:hypothetical protein
MTNPKFKISNLGARWYDYILLIPTEDGKFREVKGSARVNETITIPLFKNETDTTTVG